MVEIKTFSPVYRLAVFSFVQPPFKLLFVN